MENPINLSCPWCGEIFVSFFLTHLQETANTLRIVRSVADLLFVVFYIDENGEVYVDTQRE